MTQHDISQQMEYPLVSFFSVKMGGGFDIIQILDLSDCWNKRGESIDRKCWTLSKSQNQYIRG